MVAYRDYLELKRTGTISLIHESRGIIFGEEWKHSSCDDSDFFAILKRGVLVNIDFYNSDINMSEVMYSKDGEVININLISESDWSWKWIARYCENLRYLFVNGNLEISEDFFNLKEIKYLGFINCTLKNVNLERISEFKNLEALDFYGSDIEELPEAVLKLKNLKVLSLMFTGVSDLPASLSVLQNIQYLGLNGSKIRQVPKVVMNLINLRSLYLGKTSIDELPQELSQLTKLEYLAIWETNLHELPEWICTLHELRGLYLGRTKGICALPCSFGELKKLEDLSLDGTGIENLPDSFGHLTNLEQLNLENTKIHRLPEFMEMPNLKYCNLSNLEIEKIPREFISSSMKIYFRENIQEGLILENTKVLCQPLSLFTHEKEFIHAYYEEEKIHLNETKVVFLGDGEAGKSHIIQRIKKNGNKLREFKEEATPGIAISQKQCEIDSETVCLQIWDFGGQEIMHSMHRFFLTERTLYVVVVNARDNTQDERAKYWLNNIKSFADGCPVIIVLNKMDQNPTASINERLLRNDYPQIVDLLKMSALNDGQASFGLLMERILDVVKTFDSYAMEFPVTWNNIKSTLSNMESSYITDPQYREICQKYNVTDEHIQNWLLDWFHDLGISFNYRKRDQLLGGYMVLKPTWITNAIYIILFNGGQEAQHGIVSIDSIVNLLKNPPRSVEKFRYNITEVPYILGVMRRFEISYSIDETKEFIPMMCDKNQHEDAEQFMNSDCLEYVMEYKYLPNNVLHKLMIKVRNDFDEEKIWLTGMILNARGGNISALIRMHDNSIEIFIKSNNNEIHSPKEYLGEIREHLLSINKELNLTADDMIIYKEEGISEKINYEQLLIHLSSNQREYFSPVFRKPIPIKKILGTVEEKYDIDLILQLCNENEDISYHIMFDMLMKARATGSLYEELQEDLTDACLKLQGNSLQIYEGKENDRNSYLRDLLSVNRKYVICDQTLNGKSLKGKNAGELDLLIKNYKQQPIAVLEALTLTAVNKKYIADHIDRLFLYDTWGLKNNYILCYVEAKNFYGFCDRFENFIVNYDYEYSFQRIKGQSHYSEIYIYDVVLLRNEKETVITYILVNLKG